MTAGNDLTHRVFLVRHGETVDNVAGLYAGLRDSALTNHGVIQAQKLGQYLADNKVHFTHIFSSDISRALKTAGHIQAAQNAPKSETVEVKQCVELREQDFGFLEGRSWKDDMAAMRAKHRSDPGFKDVETKQSLNVRATRFLEGFLLPLLRSADGSGTAVTVAVVSHGMLLSALWKSLLAQQRPDSVKFLPDATNGRDESLRLPGWSNTGYMELLFNRSLGTSASNSKVPGDEAERLPTQKSAASLGNDGKVPTEIAPPTSADAQQVQTEAENSTVFVISIKAINKRTHLQGIKRVGGGIGSSKHDEKQKSISSFFSKKLRQS